MQRSASPALRPLAILLIGVFEHMRIHRDHGVQLVLIERNARQVLRHQFTRRDPTLGQRRFHLGNARFHHGKLCLSQQSGRAKQ